jgi:hypothetical protein
MQSLRKRILDSGFVYVPAIATDTKETFARIRREQMHQAKAAEALAYKQGVVAIP